MTTIHSTARRCRLIFLLALLWFASQTIAADASADTLCNTLIRSLRRQDVLFGKVLVLFTTAGMATC